MSQAKRDLPRPGICLLALAILFLPAPGSRIQAAPSTPAQNLEDYWILIEPRFLRPEITLTIEGARDTFFVPGREIRDYPGVRAYTRSEFESLRIGERSFYSRASRAAARLLDTIEPELIKDEDGKTSYAVIHLERPIASGLIVADNFPEKFSPLFGDRLIVFVPERHVLFVFPDNPDIYKKYLFSMAARFEDATFACSREIFLWKNGAEKPVVIGTFDG